MHQNTADWRWTVEYRDGGELHEYVDDVHTHVWRDIELARGVGVMYLTPAPDRPDLRMVAVRLDEGQQPIFFRRGQIEVNLETGEQTGGVTVHVLGLRRPGEGKRGMSFLYLFQDGSMLLSGHGLEV